MATCTNAYKTKYADLIVCRKTAPNAASLAEAARGACIKQHYCGQTKANILDADCAACPRLIAPVKAVAETKQTKKKAVPKETEKEVSEAINLKFASKNEEAGHEDV